MSCKSKGEGGKTEREREGEKERVRSLEIQFLLELRWEMGAHQWVPTASQPLSHRQGGTVEAAGQLCKSKQHRERRGSICTIYCSPSMPFKGALPFPMAFPYNPLRMNSNGQL